MFLFLLESFCGAVSVEVLLCCFFVVAFSFLLYSPVQLWRCFCGGRDFCSGDGGIILIFCIFGGAFLLVFFVD